MIDGIRYSQQKLRECIVQSKLTFSLREIIASFMQQSIEPDQSLRALLRLTSKTQSSPVGLSGITH